MFPLKKKTRNESSQVVNRRKKDHDYEFGLSNGFKHHKNYVLSHKGCLKTKLRYTYRSKKQKRSSMNDKRKPFIAMGKF